MSLKYAILGFLRTTPRSGYDLARRFKDTMGGLVWMAGLSQIYPELRRLEQAGLVHGEVTRGERLDKRVYRLTEQGRHALQKWVESDFEAAPVRDVQRLQFLLLDSSSPELIRKHLARHRAHHESRLASLQDKLKGLSPLTNPLLKARLAVRPPGEHPVIVAVRRAALQGDVRRSEVEIEWVDATLRQIERAAETRTTRGRSVTGKAGNKRARAMNAATRDRKNT